MPSSPPVTITREYKPSDWAIFTYNPESGKFILGVSVLDTDVLGSTGGTITKLDYAPTSIIIDNGYENNGEVFWEFQPSTATVQFNVADFDTPIAEKFIIGTDLIIALKTEQTTGDIPAIGAYDAYFTGFISDFQATVTPSEKFSTFTISGTSNTQKMITKPFVIKGSNTVSMPNQMIQAGIDAYFGDLVTYPSSKYFINNFTATHTGAEFLSNYLAGSGYFWDDKTRVVLDNYQGKTVFSKTVTDADLFEIQLGWHNANNPIGAIWTNESTGVSISAGGVTVNDSSGGGIFSFTYNQDNVTNASYQNYRQQFAPISVSMVVKQTFENISFDDNSSTWDEPFPKISDNLIIDSTNLTIDGTYEVIGQQHFIDLERWTVKLNLRLKGL